MTIHNIYPLRHPGLGSGSRSSPIEVLAAKIWTADQVRGDELGVGSGVK